MRVPITLTARPWATLYRMPDGRRIWCLRLWEVDGPRTRCRSTDELRAYARANGLDGLRRAIDEAERAADRLEP